MSNVQKSVFSAKKIDEQKPLIDTEAGAAVNEDLVKLQKKHSEDIKALQDDNENLTRSLANALLI